MTSKKKSLTTPSMSQQTLKIGGRVRCTDDRVEGRIVWANAVSVKIRWDDGEQVTWRRDSLADRPIEIVEGSEDQSTSVIESPTPEQSEQIETPPAKPEAGPTRSASEQLSPHPEQSVAEASDEPAVAATAPAELHLELPAEPTESSLNLASEMTPAADRPVAETTLSEPAQEEAKTPEQTAEPRNIPMRPRPRKSDPGGRLSKPRNIPMRPRPRQSSSSSPTAKPCPDTTHLLDMCIDLRATSRTLAGGSRENDPFIFLRLSFTCPYQRDPWWEGDNFFLAERVRTRSH
jgi:hypothetical protein